MLNLFFYKASWDRKFKWAISNELAAQSKSDYSELSTFVFCGAYPQESIR